MRSKIENCENTTSVAKICSHTHQGNSWKGSVVSVEAHGDIGSCAFQGKGRYEVKWLVSKSYSREKACRSVSDQGQSHAYTWLQAGTTWGSLKSPAAWLPSQTSWLDPSQVWHGYLEFSELPGWSEYETRLGNHWSTSGTEARACGSVTPEAPAHPCLLRHYSQ
jgi:hypothetical protein